MDGKTSEGDVLCCRVKYILKNLSKKPTFSCLFIKTTNIFMKL